MAISSLEGALRAQADAGSDNIVVPMNVDVKHQMKRKSMRVLSYSLPVSLVSGGSAAGPARGPVRARCRVTLKRGHALHPYGGIPSKGHW